MNADERRSLVRAGSFLLIAVAEKLTVLHLPPHWLRGVIHIFNGAPAGFGLAVLLFGWNRLKAFRVEESIERLPAALHIVLLSALIALQHWYPHGYAAPAATGGLLLAAAIAWTALIPLIILTLLLSFVPLHHLGSLVRALAPASLYAAASTAALLVLRSAGDTAWRRSSVGVVHLIQQASFEQTRLLLQRFYPFVISIPDKHILGTPRYLIEISWLCSGIEGLLLVALLIALWIAFFRRELIVSRALWIAPVALTLTWCANIVRLAALIAIGDHGHRVVAGMGFHTQAGWVSLNLIALGCLFTMQNISWFRRDPAVPRNLEPQAMLVNYPALYLLPFTLILASSLVTRGFAAGFEELYFLRLLAALLAFWIFRRQYGMMNWRFGVRGVLAGTLVGLLWVVVDLHFRTTSADAVLTASALNAATRLHRWMWILIRTAAAVFTVPIAEELAFRGFIARRVMRADFETVPYQTMNWTSLAVSSLAFGLLHGQQWLPGIVAGVVFWWCARERNRLGEAIAAHAVANGIIAIAALAMRDFTMW